jgi:hypothetical protein
LHAVSIATDATATKVGRKFGVDLLLTVTDIRPNTIAPMINNRAVKGPG